MCPNYQVLPSEEFITPRVYRGASATPGHPGATLRPEDVLISEPHSIIPKSLPLRGLYHFEVFLVVKVSTPNLKLQQQIIYDLC